MTNYTETHLSSMTIVEIVALHNEFAAITGDSPVKRFSSKKVAIERTLKIQEIAAPSMDAEPEEQEAEDTRMYHVVRINERNNKKTILSATPMTHSEAVNFKDAQSKYDWARDQLEEVLTETAKAKEDKAEEPTKHQQVVSIANKPNFRKGSIGEMMFGHIECNEGIALQELVDYMVANYKKPRADSEVDAAFITSTVRYFVRKGALEIK